VASTLFAALDIVTNEVCTNIIAAADASSWLPETPQSFRGFPDALDGEE
jgi:hypothetical protein